MLVIAVLFTFSFGSAFAAVATPEQQTKLLEAEAYAKQQIKTNFEQYMKAPKDVVVVGINVKAATWTNQKDAVWALIEKAISNLTAAQLKNFTAVGADVNALANEVYLTPLGMGTVAGVETWMGTDENCYDIAKVQFDLDVKEEMKPLDSVDMNQYSTTTPEGKKVYADRVKEAVADMKVVLDKKIKDGIENKTLLATFNEIHNYVVARFEPSYIEGTAAHNPPNGYPTGLYLLTPLAINEYKAAHDDMDIKTKKQESTESLTNAATVAAVKAAAQKKYAEYLQANTADKDVADAYIAVYNFLAEEGIVTDPSTVEDVADMVAKKPQDVVKAVNELKAFAEKLKAEKNGDGTLVRNAEAIDAIVNNAIANQYAKLPAVVQNAPDATYPTIAAAMEAIRLYNQTQDAINLAYVKQVLKTKLENDKADAKDNYYEKEYAKVQAKYDEALAKLEAADTMKKVNKIGSVTNYNVAGQPENIVIAPAIDLAGIKTKDDVKALLKTFEGFTNATTAVNNYVTYVNGAKLVTDPTYIVYNADKVEKALLKLFGEAGARTNDEVKATPFNAADIAAKLPTYGGQQAAVKAAVDAIKALPTSPAVADKDAVLKAFELKGEAEDMLVTLPANDLDQKIEKLYQEMLKNFVIRSAQADKADKAGLQALLKEIKEANKLFGDGELFGAKVKFPTTIVDAALKALKDAEKKAVVDAVRAIPLNITSADRDTVKKARDLYDAYVKEYTDYEKPYNEAKDLAAQYSELVKAEAIVGLSVVDPAKLVEGLKITARSIAKKGSITVKWTVVGDTKSVKGYEIWRSTKKTSGFKKMITTSKTTYKNTKNLKKGVRYYYKVRAIAYTADKVKVKSDWSNKAFRVAK